MQQRNPNNDCMTKAEDNFSDSSKKSLFWSVSTDQSFETKWRRHCKERKQEVKQTLEKPKNIIKSLQSTPSSDDLFGMMVAVEIKNLSPKKKRKFTFETNNLLFKYQEDDDATAVSEPPPI